MLYWVLATPAVNEGTPIRQERPPQQNRAKTTRKRKGTTWGPSDKPTEPGQKAPQVLPRIEHLTLQTHGSNVSAQPGFLLGELI